MTFGNFMTMRKAGNAPAPTPSPDAKPPEECKKSGLSAYGMVALGILLFTIGGMFNNAPLKGQHKFLVATITMPDKQLQKSVVFIARHDRAAAMGFILNEPGSKGQPGFGGTQETTRLFALHTLDVTLPETIAMKDVGLGLVEGKDAIEKLKKAKPAWFEVVHGYEGWGAHQLESEISLGLWELVEFDSDALTKTPPAKFWDVARKLPKFELTH